jgi:hypothetical protein
MLVFLIRPDHPFFRQDYALPAPDGWLGDSAGALAAFSGHSYFGSHEEYWPFQPRDQCLMLAGIGLQDIWYRAMIA